MTRYCWGLRTVYMGDLPPSVTEEWVKELVGDIGVFSYLKVFFISQIIPFGQSHLCLKNESICIVLSQKLYITYYLVQTGIGFLNFVYDLRWG